MAVSANPSRLAYQQAVADAIAAELKKRGHKVSQTAAQINMVDGVFVGVWLMPRRTKFILRVGFADNLLEWQEPDVKNVGKLTDWVLEWLKKNRAASVARFNDRSLLAET